MPTTHTSFIRACVNIESIQAARANIELHTVVYYGLAAKTVELGKTNNNTIISIVET